MSVAAVVLAAGYSSRMGFFKPLAPLIGVSVLERSLRSLVSAGVFEVLVVTGFHGEEVAQAIEESGARVIRNPRFKEGMFTSIQAGISALPAGCDAFFLLPADIPTVRASSLRLLMENVLPDGVVHPLFRGARGHPPLVGAALVPAIMSYSGEDGLRGFYVAHEPPVRVVPVADEGVLIDMDRPEEYEKLRRRAFFLETPSRPEGEALFELAGTPLPVRHHCEMTASVCLSLGIALKRSGVTVDLPLLKSAALFHDVCRHLGDHVREGELFLRRHGFPLVAEIAAQHTDLPALPRIEASILHLVDKLVLDTKIVSLAYRKRIMKARYGADHDAWAAITKRYRDARRSELEIERLTGQSLVDLLVFPQNP